tara:strand:- start:72051 stop:74006 length:1956 start_codon:yes stop_codon:yes gene_type:complete
MNYRSEIDGLRALAVLPVMFFHAGFSSFKGGYVGVDVFFVISGYLISSLIIQDLGKNKFSLVEFYERRSRRILPALFFVMIVSLPFAWFLLPPTEMKDFGQSLAAVSIFSSNFLFWLESGYFETSSELKPLLHTWSLAVEEQFYILFPLIMMFLWRIRYNFIVIIFFLLFLFSLAFSHWAAFNSPSANFYLLPSRAWELLIGVFLGFFLAKNPLNSYSFNNQILSIIGFGMILISVFLFDDSTPFPSLYSLIPTLGTAILILTAVRGTLMYKVLTWKLLTGIGLISYSAYLWHQPVIAFARYYSLGDLNKSHLLGLILTSFIFALFSYKYIETPFRKNKILFTRKIIFSLSFILIFIFTSLGSLLHFKQGLSDRVDFSSELKNSFQIPQTGKCFDKEYSHLSDEWGCVLGDNKNSIDFALLGDSHSLSLKNTLDKLGKKHNKAIFFVGYSGCLPFIDIYPNRKDQVERNCYELNKRIFNFLIDKNIKEVIMSARWSYYTDGDYDKSWIQNIAFNEKGPFSREISRLTFKESFISTVKRYAKNDINIHLLTQPPQQKFAPESLYFRSRSINRDIYNYSVLRSDFSLLEDYPLKIFRNNVFVNLNLIHILDEYCDQLRCPVGTTQLSYYFDEDHLNQFGVKLLEPTLESIILK